MTTSDELREAIKKAMAASIASIGNHKHHAACIHNLPPEEQVTARGRTVEWWLKWCGNRWYSHWRTRRLSPQTSSGCMLSPPTMRTGISSGCVWGTRKSAPSGTARTTRSSDERTYRWVWLR